MLLRSLITGLLLVAVLQGGAQDLYTGLVGCYSFSGNANDASGEGNHGVVSRAVLIADRFGNPGSAYLFDGSGSSIALPPGAFANPAFTYSAWIKVTSFPRRGQSAFILSVGSLLGEGQALRINNFMFSSDVIYGIGTDSYFSDNGTNSETKPLLDEYSTPPVDRWIHVAFVRDRSTGNFFLNGELVGQFYLPGPGSTVPYYGNPSAARIGARSDGNNFFDGAIDDVAIYNRTLSYPEIQFLFLKGLPCVTTFQPLVNNVSLCGKGSASLTATGGAVFHWYDKAPGGQFLFEGNPFTTPVLDTTTTYYAASVNNGIESARTKVTVTLLPPLYLACGDSVYGAVNETVTLAARVSAGKAPFQYAYNFDDESQTITTDTSAAHAFKAAGFYPVAVMVTDANHCMATCLENVVIIGKPVVEDAIVCTSASVILTAGGGLGYRWYDAAVGGNLLWEGNPFRTPLLVTTTSYFVSSYRADLESPRSKVSVLFASPPNLIISIPREAQPGVPVPVSSQVSNGIPPYRYEFDFGDGQVISTALGTEFHTYSETGVYRVSATVVDSARCTAADTVTIRIPELRVPDVITSNTDSINNRMTVFEKVNQRWMVYSGDLPFSLLITNRWGQQVYATHDPITGWTANGCSAGIYFFEITLGKRRYNGWVSVIN